MSSGVCRFCVGRGVIRAADVYKNLATGKVAVDWELATVIACGCKYREAS